MKVLVFVLLFMTMCFAENHRPVNVGELDEKYLNVFNLKYKTLKQSFPKIKKIPLVKASSQLFFIKDTNSKFFKIKIIFPIGSLNDRKGKEGEIYFTFSNMIKGGTKSFSKSALDSILDFYSMDLNYSVGAEFSSISFTCLMKDLDIGKKILYEVLNKPLFNEDELSLQKDYVRDYYKRILDNPNMFLSWKYKELLYGKNAYSRPSFGNIKSIENLNIGLLKKDYNKIQNVGSLQIGIAANMSLIKAPIVAWGIIGKMNKRTFFVDKNSFVKIKKHKKAVDIVFFDKPDLNQVFLRFGHRGIGLYSKDYFNNIVAMNILGSGGFNSRYLNEIRVKRGLSYSPGFTHRTNTFVKGDYVGYVQTRTEKIGEVLDVSYSVVDSFVRFGVSNKEVKRAKKSIINSLPFLYDSKYGFLNLVLDYSSKNRKIKNLYKLNKIYSKISRKDINKSIKRNLSKPDKFQYIMIGNWKKSKKVVVDFAKKHNFKYKVISLKE